MKKMPELHECLLQCSQELAIAVFPKANDCISQFLSLIRYILILFSQIKIIFPVMSSTKIMFA